MVLPSGANIHPFEGINLGALEPQFLQKAFPKVFGGSKAYSPVLSSPEIHLNWFALTKRFVANAAPVTFLHLEH